MRVNVVERNFDDKLWVRFLAGPHEPLPGDQLAILRWDGERWIGNSFDPRELLDQPERPSLELPMDMARELYLALEEHFERVGKPSKSTSYTEGRLEATEKWLEDMRKLVFGDG